MSERLCEMIHVTPGNDGMGVESPCTQPATRMTEDGVPCCSGCGLQHEHEGFTTSDLPDEPEPTAEPLAAPGASDKGEGTP